MRLASRRPTPAVNPGQDMCSPQVVRTQIPASLSSQVLVAWCERWVARRRGCTPTVTLDRTDASLGNHFWPALPLRASACERIAWWAGRQLRLRWSTRLRMHGSRSASDALIAVEETDRCRCRTGRCNSLSRRSLTPVFFRERWQRGITASSSNMAMRFVGRDPACSRRSCAPPGELHGAGAAAASYPTGSLPWRVGSCRTRMRLAILYPSEASGSGAVSARRVRLVSPLAQRPGPLWFGSIMYMARHAVLP